MMITKFVYLSAFFLLSLNVYCQNYWEIGARYGDNFSIDATVPLNDNHRIHAGFYVEDRFATGLYWNWVWGIEDGPQRIKLYPGIGPELYFGDSFDFGVAADLGFEFRFDIPLTIGIDWRPGILITDGFDFHTSNWGFLARFRIGGG